jgi:hypothetical protein
MLISTENEKGRIWFSRKGRAEALGHGEIAIGSRCVERVDFDVCSLGAQLTKRLEQKHHCLAAATVLKGSIPKVTVE